MSTDKAKIKAVFRSRELRNAITLLPDDCTLGPVPKLLAASVRTIFEDGSVRFSMGLATTGRELYNMFASTIAAAFKNYTNVHTYVLCFDDKRNVPTRKAQTQAGRREKLEASAKRKRVVEWHWDHVSPIVVLADDTELPPWDYLRLDRAAYGRALDELVALIADTFTPPPGCRLILDTGERRPRVVEASLNGHVLAVHNDAVRGRGTLGEADMTAQFYARWARDSRHELVERSRDAYPARAHATAHIDTLAHYYSELTLASTPLDDRVIPAKGGELIALAHLRARYEAGDVLLNSTDTDFITLSVPHYAMSLTLGHNLHVLLGRAHLGAPLGAPPPQPPAGAAPPVTSCEQLKGVGEVERRGVGGVDPPYCTGTTVGAQSYREYVDIGRLLDEVCRLHVPLTADPVVAAWSFAAFCTACGNDYTKRLFGLSHEKMFAAYKRWLQSKRNEGEMALRATSGSGEMALRATSDSGGCGGGAPSGAPTGNLVRVVRDDNIPFPVATLNPPVFGDFIRHCYYEKLHEKYRPVHGVVPQWLELQSIVNEANKVERARMPTFATLHAYFEQVAWSLAYASSGPHDATHVPA